MKRALIAVITALPLAVGVASAQADGFPGMDGTGTPQVAVAGTVTSVSGTTISANAWVVTPPSQGDDNQGDDGDLPGFGDFGFGSFPGFSFAGIGGGTSFGGGGSWSGFGGSQGTQYMRANDMSASPTPPATTPVTITTNSSTLIRIRGMGDGEGTSGTTPPTVANLTPGTRFLALFPGSPTQTIQQITANPATAIFAEIPKQFYAFAGTVTATTAGTSTIPGSVTVNVTNSMPSGLFSGSSTFTVSPGTLVIGGSGGGTGFSLSDLFGGSLTDVQTGDMVTGGLIGPSGLTATQAEAMPLMFLLDFPATTSSSAAQKAMRETMRLLHGGRVHLGKKHARRSHHHSKHSRRTTRH